MRSQGATVAARCHSQAVINLITQTLDEENLLQFRNGPFGALLKLQHSTLNYQCQLFYYCMKLLNRCKRRKGLLVFNFNNREVVFGPCDFYVMSGLSFGPVEELPSTSTLWTTSFGEVKTLTMSKIIETFKTAKEDSDDAAGGGELCLKLAYVLFIYGVLFPRDSDAKKLDMKYLHVCDDLNRIVEFPWGFFSYKYFVKEFDKACKRMESLVSKRGKPNYEIFGFLFVFQCWIYEIFPSVGADCGYRLEGWENIYPRVLRWKTASGQRQFKHIQFLFAAAKNMVHPLMTSNEEQLRIVCEEQYLDEELMLEVEKEDEQIMDEEHEHVDVEHEQMEEEQKDAPVVERKSVKRKLDLASGACSTKADMKRRPGLRSGDNGVGKNAAADKPENEEDEGGSHQSFPSISTPDAKESNILQMMSIRMEKLEACCSNLNEKWGGMNDKLGRINEKLGMLMEFMEALGRGSQGMRGGLDSFCEGNRNPTSDLVEKGSGEPADKLFVDEDKLINIHIIEISSNHPSHIEDLCDAFVCDGRDDLDEACIDEYGQMRIVHCDDVVDDVVDADPANGTDVEDDVDSVDHDDGKDAEDAEEDGENGNDAEDAEEDGENGKDAANYGDGNVGDGTHLPDNNDDVPDKNQLMMEDDKASFTEVDMIKLNHLVDHISGDILGTGRDFEAAHGIQRNNKLLDSEVIVEEDNLVACNVENVAGKHDEEQLLIAAEIRRKLSVIAEVCVEEEQVVPKNFQDVLNAEDEMCLGLRGSGKPSRRNTRSNPVLLTSSSEGSSSINERQRSRKRRGGRMAAASRFAGQNGLEATDTIFDPLRKYGKSFVQPFKTWYDKPPRNQRGFKLRSYCPYKVGQWFFQDLIEKRAWLSTVNCDALLNMLLFKANLKPNIFLSRWTVLENRAWECLCATDVTPYGNTLLHCAKGFKPEVYGKPWREVDQVVGIAHVFGNHFVAFQIRIPEQEIVVFDSMCESEDRWAAVKGEFMRMSYRMNWLCKDAGVIHFKGPVKILWDVIQNPDTPQQPNEHDCGIYSMKVIECLVSGRPVSYLLKEPFSNRSRLYYCAELFNTRFKQ